MSLGITWIDAIIWGVITFSILIVLHEGGHFLAARAFGVKVHEFMVGLPGPALSFTSKKTGTRFGVTAVPLGGYVRIAGMEPGKEDECLADALVAAGRLPSVDARGLSRMLDVSDERAAGLLGTLADWGALAESPDTRGSYMRVLGPGRDEDPEAMLARARKQTYRGLKTWQRVVVLAAGVVVNLVVAILVLSAVIALAGDARPTLTLAQANLGAAEAGMMSGDIIRQVDGVTIDSFEELVETVSGRADGEVVTVVADRDGTVMRFSVKLTEADDGAGGKRAMLGVAPDFEYGPVPIGEAITRTFMLVGLVAVAIVSFFNPQTFPVAVQGARSIIGASEEIAYAVQAGPADFAALVALLSLSLGLMNVLPIPPLDGGKIALEFVERLIGRPLPREVSLGFSLVGALLLFSFIGYLMYADVARLAAG